MVFVDHLKGSKPEQKFLEVAFGMHVIKGDLAKSIVTGTSPSHVVTIQQKLGDAFGKGWKGPKGIWYAGTNRPAAKYKFYPGKQTPNPTLFTYTADNSTNVFSASGHTFANGDMIIFEPGDTPLPILAGTIYYARDVVAGTSFKAAATSGGAAIDLTDNGSGTLKVYKNDAVQGIDPVFNLDTPHSNVAWIRVEAPSGSEVGIPDANTKDNPPDGLTGVYECQLGDIYDDTGAVTASDQLLTNPADVIAFGLKVIREYPDSRINWASLDVLRQVCDATYTPDYTVLLPQGVGLTGRYYEGTSFGTLKQKRIDPVIQYDLSTGAPALDLTATSFSVRWEGKIRFKYSETYTFTLVHNDSGKLWIDNLTTPIIDQAASGTHTGTFAAAADAWYDIKIEWTNAAGDSQLRLDWASPSQPYQTVPQDRLWPKNEAMKRFEAHIAFTARTTFDDFLRAALFTCNGAMQDVDGKLTFFCIDEISPSFGFDQGNIVKNSINYYPRFSQQEILSLPNRFIAEGRDLDSRYLEPYDPPLQYDIPSLQAEAGRIIEEIIVVGNMTRAQALENITHYAKLRTAPMVCELEGMPQTFPVLPGDLVTVTDQVSGWNDKGFICMEAIDNSIDAAADNRRFTLLDWYDNGDVTAFLAAAGVSDPTIGAALDTLVATLKSDGIWTKLDAIYPFVGGTAFTHKFNLKNPADTDAAFRITWAGTVTHDANGITGDGSTGYGNTHYDPSVQIPANEGSLGVYVQSNGSLTTGEIGCIVSGSADYQIATNYSGTAYFGANGAQSTATAGAAGFHQVSRVDASNQLYKIAGGTANNYSSAYSAPSLNAYIGALNNNGSPGDYSSRTISFAYMGHSLTSSELTDLYNAVQAYQTALGRNV